MTLAETLKRCHEIVWTYRRELEDVWPTPSTEDALLFAVTELGEAIDAHLRSKPQYARNRAKDLDVLDELADCAMMLLTALGPGGAYWWGADLLFDVHEWWAYLVTMPRCFERDRDGGTRAIATQLTRIATHPGMDLPARLTARLERIKAKRLEVTHG